MLITRKDKELIVKRDPRKGMSTRKPDPNSIASEARALGMKPGTWLNRLKAVKAGKMTLEEAKTKPVRSRLECGQMAAKKKWGGKK